MDFNRRMRSSNAIQIGFANTVPTLYEEEEE